MKVYCSECEYLLTVVKNNRYECEHKKNVERVDNSDWFKERKNIVEYKLFPISINAYNACQWFKRTVGDRQYRCNGKAAQRVKGKEVRIWKR